VRSSVPAILQMAKTKKLTMAPTTTPIIDCNIETSTTFYKGGVYTYSVSAPGAVSDAVSSDVAVAVSTPTATGC